MARRNNTTLVLTIGGIALGAGVLYYAWSSGFLAELTGGGAAAEPTAEEPTTAAPETVPGVTDYPTLTDTLNAPAVGGGPTSPYTPYPTDDGYVDTPTPTPTYPTPTYPTPDAQGCYAGTRWSNCYRACVPAGLNEPTPNSVHCVGYVPPVVTPPAPVPGPTPVGGCPQGQIPWNLDGKPTCVPQNATCAQLFGGGCGTECDNGKKLTDPKCIACRNCFPNRPHVMCKEGEGYKWNGSSCVKTTTPVPVPPVTPPPAPTPTCAQQYGSGCGTECANGTKLTDSRCISCRACFPGRPHIMCNEDQGYRWTGTKCAKPGTTPPIPIPIPVPKPTPKPVKCKVNRSLCKSRYGGNCSSECKGSKRNSSKCRDCRCVCTGTGVTGVLKSINVGSVGGLNLGSLGLGNLGNINLNSLLNRSNMALAYAGSSYDGEVLDSAYYVAPSWFSTPPSGGVPVTIAVA